MAFSFIPSNQQTSAEFSLSLGQGSNRFIMGNPEISEKEETKLIICWGDSLTEGIGADEAVIERRNGQIFDASYLSYPEVLSKLTGITTFNFGIDGANSAEIVETHNALMQVLQTTKEILSNNKTTKAIKQGIFSKPENANDAGRAKDSKSAKNTEDVESSKKTNDTTDSADSAEKPQVVLILEIGSNGGWEGDYNTLIEQYNTIIKNTHCDNFLILGDTDDPELSADSTQEAFKPGEGPGETAWEKALSEYYGEHFVNVRVFLIEHGLEIAGLEETEQDIEYADVGCISPQLRTGWTHLNSYGYYAKALAIYLQGAELGYWNVNE